MRERAAQLRQERGTVIAEARRILADTSLSVEARNSGFDAQMAKADEIKAEIDRIEILITAEAELATRQELSAAKNGVSTDEQNHTDDIENETFNAFLIHGVNGMTDAQRTHMVERNAKIPEEIKATMSTTTGSEGGYSVPEGFYTKLDVAMLQYAGGMIDGNIVTVLNTATGNNLPMPTSDDTSNTGERLAQNAEATRADVAFGTALLEAFIYSSKIVRAPHALMQDSAFDLAGFIAERLGERIGRILNLELTVGAGTTGIPEGIVTGSTLGVTAAGIAAITELELIDLEHSVDPAYRERGRYMFSDNVLKLLRKLVDGDGRPVFQAGMAVGSYDTIHSYPFKVNQSVPQPTTGLKSVIFGDLKKYHTRLVSGAFILRLVERYAEFFQVGFIGYKRADGVTVDAGTNPIKHLIQA